MIYVLLSESDRLNKKYQVIIKEYDSKGNLIKKKTLNFGAKGYDDYTLSNNETKKINYIKRHEKRENFDDIYTNGFWSKNLLWNKKTIRESIKDIENKYNVKVYKYF